MDILRRIVCNIDTLFDFKNGLYVIIALLATVVFAYLWSKFISKNHKKDRKVTPIRILFGGTFISAVIYFLPIMLQVMDNEVGWGYRFDALVTSIQYALRLFILDGEILWIFDTGIPLFENHVVKGFYVTVGSILYVSAPILTFTFVLTFFNNLFAHINYLVAGLSSKYSTHVFSELNEKSLALATDIKNKNYKETVVFTEISEKVLEEQMELVEDARMLGAILLRKDFDSIKFRYKHSRRELSFYLISDDEQKKLRHAEVVMKIYDYDKVTLHLFSPDIRSELLMASYDPQNMKAIRINDIQTLIYHNLYTHGKMLFDRARDIDGEKVISAVIVGLGQYGTEMLKALSWFCQMDGYKIKITAFDSDENAEEKLKFMCPEVFDSRFNGPKPRDERIYGEPYYEIKIEGGVDVTTPDFKDRLAKITDASYIFVCLGTDEINLNTAKNIRSICESINYGDKEHKPDIETVVYDSKIAYAIGTTWEDIISGKTTGVTNFKNEPYRILITGDLESFYSVSTLVNSELINAGFKIQLGYSAGNDESKKKDPEIIKSAERTFWKYDYNHNSSIAKAIHLKLRKDLKVYKEPAKDWDQLSREEKIVYANPEHIRWSAYMRSIGYTYGKRNDLGKKHHCLVPTHMLSDNDLRKD